MLIAIEGVLGAGKSTLQRLLCQEYNAISLEQEFENHPYLEKYYQNASLYALEKDMIFLFMGYHQLTHLEHDKKLIISDFIFEKSLVFAQHEFDVPYVDKLLVPSYHYLSTTVTHPDIVIWLIASSGFLLDRIKIRARKMEQAISIKYLESLQTSYSSVFSNYSRAPIVKIDVETKDFLHNPSDLSDLMDTIERYIPKLSQFRKSRS